MENLGADELKDLFAASQLNHPDKVNFSEEETVKFKKAFDDPEFRKLFSDYVTELQDPAHREETEQYISQLEGDNKVPAGKQLIRPVPGFVAKTHKITKGVKDDKVFINIVSSELIDKPTKTDTKDGQNWSLPYSLGPPHMEADKQKDPNVEPTAIASFDCCFHPEALKFASSSKPFRDLLVSTAIEGVETGFKKVHTDTKLNKEFHVLKGVTYKTGQVPTMLVDIAATKTEWKDQTASSIPTKTAAPASTSSNSVATTPAASTSSSAAPKSSVPSVPKGFLNKQSAKKTPPPPVLPPKPLIQEVVPAAVSHDTATSSSNTSPPVPPVVAPSPVVRSSQVEECPTPVPLFTVLERGIVSMGDFESSRSTTVVSNRPAELVYKIELPLVVKASQVDLDVSEKMLKLDYQDIYHLLIPLPYPVFDKKGTAKYEKAKKCLVVTIPVRPPAAQPKDENVEEVTSKETSVSEVMDATPSSPLPTSSATTTSAGSGSVASGSGDVRSSDKEGTKIAKPTRTTSVNFSPKVAPVDEASRLLKEEIAEKAAKAKADYEQSLLEKEAMEKISNKVLSAAPPAVPESEPKRVVSFQDDAPAAVGGDVEGSDVDSVSTGFLPSLTFAGKKAGYVFKRGDKGQGYYRDYFVGNANAAPSTPPTQPSPAAAPRPVVPQYEKRDIVSTDALDMSKMSFSSSSKNPVFELD